MNQKQKIILVIFLTVFFSLIAISISYTPLLVSSFIVLMVLFLLLVVVTTIQKINQIHESTPAFLNFVNLTMSTGKSFAQSFEMAIFYQKTSIRPFYQRIHHRVFYLKDENSGFYLGSQRDFYKKIFIISSQTIHQREKINKLKLQIAESIKINKKQRSLRAPFKLQTSIFCFLYSGLLIWHFNFRNSYPDLEFLSIIFFIFGQILSFYIGRSKNHI